MGIRLRLTLLYGGLFLLAGAVLIAVIYVLVTGWSAVPAPPIGDLPAITPPAPPLLDPGLQSVLDGQRAADRRRLLISSGAALGVMTVLAAGLGWVVAGRVLDPLRTMTATVRGIGADQLDRRLAATGPADELTALADTFDELLDRVETAFAAQRRFVADASHELRTPLTVARTLTEVALADPDADAAALRSTLGRLLAVGTQSERLLDALLTLARGQQARFEARAVDLADAARAALDEPTDLTITADLQPAVTAGDPDLIGQLARNLVTNAVRHNVAGGWLEVATTTHGGAAVLRVRNSGPVIPAADLARLLQPFQRLAPGRARHREGSGLGLAIVAAIVEAHGAGLRLEALPAGGLEVTVSFAAVSLSVPVS